MPKKGQKPNACLFSSADVTKPIYYETKKSLTKLSLLSLALLAAPAVTAAILPSMHKDNDTRQANSSDNATLYSANGVAPGAGVVKSCVADEEIDVIYSYHLTVNATKTGASSEALGFRSVGNTSDSWPLFPGDTTSVVS